MACIKGVTIKATPIAVALAQGWVRLKKDCFMDLIPGPKVIQMEEHG
jgi:hypothetical protein